MCPARRLENSALSSPIWLQYLSFQPLEFPFDLRKGRIACLHRLRLSVLERLLRRNPLQPALLSHLLVPGERQPQVQFHWARGRRRFGLLFLGFFSSLGLRAAALRLLAALGRLFGLGSFFLGGSRVCCACTIAFGRRALKFVNQLLVQPERL